MTPLERHRDVGAYALGVLDRADAFRFEDHLMDCPRCVAQFHELRPTTHVLKAYADSTPDSVDPFAAPRPGMLDQLLRDVAAMRRTGRRRWLVAVAAAVVFAAGGPVIAVFSGGGTDGMRLQASDARSGVSAKVTTLNRAWGSQVDFTIKDPTGRRACHLVAVTKDGSEQTVMSWVGSGGSGEATAMQGGAAAHPSEIARFEVRTADGEKLVTLKSR
ncbi:anti-sigma factor family protein [Streptomyces cavernae]|uniref:anti-sigma factor family protein n=1 Tax=Streptomyces cavernae TaxID=2259034 RepID=UPI000FEC0B4F|nr:zf-HC2 domain-containing protein [Streptomyces cavernae]